MKKKLLVCAMLAVCGLLLLPAAKQKTEASEKITEEVVGECYTVDGTTVTVSNVSDQYSGIRMNAALAYAGQHATDQTPYTVVIPAGSYSFYYIKNVDLQLYGEPSGTENFTGLHVYSNTILDATDCTIKIAEDQGPNMSNMIQLGSFKKEIHYKGVEKYNYSSYNSGYTGFSNITIKGGTWKGAGDATDDTTSSLVKLYHATNVTLTDMTLAYGSCKHMVEVAAMKNFYVTNCHFKLTKREREGSERCEALQLDVCCNSGAFNTGYNDGTPLDGVYITGCNFYEVLDGVGTHSALVGSYHRNIVIQNNSFTNISGNAIEGVSYENCDISNNEMYNCGGGISVKSFFEPTAYAQSNYIFTHAFDGATSCNNTPSYNGGLAVYGNTITQKTGGYNTVFGIEIKGGYLNYPTYSKEGVMIPQRDYFYNNVSVKNNNVASIGRGIEIYDVRQAVVAYNTITLRGASESNVGVYVSRGSTVTKLLKNTIKSINPNAYGIYVTDDAVVSNIKSNSISKTKMGIVLISGGTVSGVVKSNSISNTTSSGIYIGNEGYVPSITSNKVYTPGSHGIVVKNNSTNRVVSIYKNRLRGISTAKKYSAIYVEKANVSISENKINKWKKGISTTKYSVGNIYDNSYSTVKIALCMTGKKTYKLASNHSTPNVTGISGGKKSVNTEWTTYKFKSYNGKKKYKATKYVLTYSKSKTMKKPATTVSFMNAKTIKGLSAKKTYYVEVQAYRKFNGMNVYSKASKICSAKTTK